MGVRKERKRKRKKERGGPSRELNTVFYVQNPRKLYPTLAAQRRFFSGTDSVLCSHKEAEREKKCRGEKKERKDGMGRKHTRASMCILDLRVA